MHVTELALNKALGIQLTPSGPGPLLAMPESAVLLNHVGTVHASAQFALAEASSGEFLLQQLGAAQDQVFAVLRNADVKFRKPAHGTLHASAHLADAAANSWSTALASRGRTLVAIAVAVADAHGVVTMTGTFEWFLQRPAAI